MYACCFCIFTSDHTGSRPLNLKIEASTFLISRLRLTSIVFYTYIYIYRERCVLLYIHNFVVHLAILWVFVSASIRPSFLIQMFDLLLPFNELVGWACLCLICVPSAVSNLFKAPSFAIRQSERKAPSCSRDAVAHPKH